MPTTIKCPMCKRALEVSDELMGKRVKCPGCKMIFRATPPGAAPSEDSSARRSKPSQKSEEAVRRKRPAPPPDEDEDEEDEEEEEQPRVRKKAPRRHEEDYEDEEDEDEDEDEEEEEDRPRRRPKRTTSSRQRAREAVLAPAICLMVVGGLGIVTAIMYLVLQLFGLSLLAAAKPEAGGMPQTEFASSVSASIGIAVTGICWGCVVTLGAFQMKNLTSRGYAMTASITAMVPGCACCLLGLPIGIWALIVINRPDVRAAFG